MADRYLFLGGQFHGELRDVDNDEPVVKAFAKPVTTTTSNGTGPTIGGGPLLIQSWVRRVLTAQDPVTGESFRNTVYIHETIADPQAMFAILAAHLAVEWARQGEKVSDA